MNLLTGEITAVYAENGITMARVRVGTVYMRVSIALIEGARAGERVLIESGVAIARVTNESPKEG
jgi:hydrogenase maturation factor